MQAAMRRNWVFGGMGAAAALLLLLLGWESDWGEAVQGKLAVPTATASKPTPLALLEDFTGHGGIMAHSEVIARPLLTPTRQPAPPAAVTQTRPAMQRGQFVLVGTILAGGKSYAFLRETNAAKQVRVAKGDRIRELTILNVEPNTVLLGQEAETEILVLKTITGPRPAAAAKGVSAPGSTPGVVTNGPAQGPEGFPTAHRLQKAGTGAPIDPGGDSTHSRPLESPQEKPRVTFERKVADNPGVRKQER